MFDLTGRFALVTGGGFGLGRGFAQALARQGAIAICADIDGGRAAETVGLIQKEGGKAEAITVDVGDKASVDEMVAKVRNLTPKLSVLINNAGVASIPARVQDVPVEEWDRVIRVNLRGVFLCTQALLPLLLAAKSSSVINISSYLSLAGAYPGFPMTAIQYGTSKAGVIGFTRQLAVEYATEGLRANVISPGYHFPSDLGRERKNTATPEERKAFLDFGISSIPQRRFSSPEEIAALAVYLASDEASYVTGQVIGHDGGMMAT